MTGLPGVVFIVDSNKEEIAVREANRLGIPVVAIADTNADPDLLTVPIAGNDDAIRSVSLITRAIADTIEAARRETPEMPSVDEGAEAYTYSTDAAEVEDTSRSRRKRPRRRPRPEAIAQRMHHAPTPESAAEEGAEAGEGQAEGESEEVGDQDEAEAKNAVQAAGPAEAEGEAPAESEAEAPATEPGSEEADDGSSGGS